MENVEGQTTLYPFPGNFTSFSYASQEQETFSVKSTITSLARTTTDDFFIHNKYIGFRELDGAMTGATVGRCTSAPNLLVHPSSIPLIGTRTKIYQTSDGAVDARYCNIVCLNTAGCQGFNYKYD